MTFARVKIPERHASEDWADAQANPSSFYPAVSPYYNKPNGTKRWIKYTPEMLAYLLKLQVDVPAYKELLWIAGGIFNAGGNKFYLPERREANTRYYIPAFGPWPEPPKAEPVTSINNYVKILEERGSWVRIETIPQGTIPDFGPREKPWLFNNPFTSIQPGTHKMGNAIDSRGVIVPLYSNGEAWMHKDKLDIGVELPPQEKPMSIELRPHGLSGKGMYLWNIERVENGDPERIAQVAKSAGLTHVLIKIANGPYAYNGDLAVPTANALNDIGIHAWGWQYIYGINPEQEAEQAMMQIQETGVRGFVVNAEVQFKGDGMDKAAHTYMNLLRQGTNVPIGFSSYKYPSYHREVPWNVFLQYSDVWMPQVYWMSFTSVNRPAEELRRAYDDFARLGIPRPFFPTGAAFKEHGWQSSPEQVTAFLKAVDDMGLDGANFWEWYNARTHVGQVIEIRKGVFTKPYPKGAMWDAISRYGRTNPKFPMPTNVRTVTQWLLDMKERLGL